MPVADLAAPDSALFLWATFPQLPEALRLIEAWGFNYKSVAFVWLKKNKKADSWFYGLGFWTRGNAEICLLATKGHPKRQAANIHQFIISPIEAHSKKPDEARDKIISLMGDLPRVELFASTFYIVIDYDKPVDEDGEQYHTYFLNMVDEADLLAALEAAGGELPACSCTEKCAPGAIHTDCAVCAVNMTECAGTAPEPAPVTEPAEEPEPEPQQKSNTGTLLLILAVAVLGSGAGWYFKIYRPKHEKAAVPEEDYSEELVDYDDPEDDGPPWDEDDTESEDNE